MKYQSFNDTPISDIRYITEFSGDAPTSVYVIRGQQGDMLIDTGFFTTYKPVLKWIRGNGFNITDIFLTHAHPDHDHNAAKFKELFNARIWLHSKDVSLIRNFPSQPQKPLDERFVKRVKWISFWTKTPMIKSKAYTPDFVIEDEGSDIPRKFGYDFSIVELPGHTLGSMGILDGNTLYCGDAYVVLNGVPMMPAHGTDLELMKKSVDRINEIVPSYLCCGHGVPLKFADEASSL